MSNGTEEYGNPQRWWEGYLVRYLLGFIVGIICILIFLHVVTPKLVDNLLKVDFLTRDIQKIAETSNVAGSEKNITQASVTESYSLTFAIGVALFGMAYCYIASTPIMVLHAARMLPTWVSGQSRAFWIAWILSLLFALMRGFDWHPAFGIAAGVAGGIILLAISFPHFGSDLDEPPVPLTALNGGALKFAILAWLLIIISCVRIISNLIENTDQELLIFSVPILWIILGQYSLLFALFRDTQMLEVENSEESVFYKFYVLITCARQMAGSRDIRDSYSHLREHSNSVFVVLIEVSLLCSLLWARTAVDSVNSGISAGSPTSHWFVFLLLLAIWLIPSIFMWGLANRLEKSFANNPKKYIAPQPLLPDA